jgi:hypothetical protein
MVVDWESVPGISYSSDAATSYTRNDLQEIVETAKQVGICHHECGWLMVQSWLFDGLSKGFMREKGVGIAINVHEQYTRLLPDVYAVLKEIRQMFPSAFFYI